MDSQDKAVNKLQYIVRSIQEFPTLPTIYTELVEIMDNPNSTTNDAANIISKDQASVLKILKLANSSIYGFRSRIDTISSAIFHIGYDEIKNLIISMAILDLFNNTAILEFINPVELWRHSIAVGVIARLLGSKMGIGNLENYFISGIIHDIGKLFFIKYFQSDYIKTFSYALECKVTLREAELEIMGITHNVVGELISEQWKIPQSIRNVIFNHTDGMVRDKFDLLTAVVHISDITARMLELGDPGDNCVPQPNIRVWEVLNLPDNTFSALYKKIILDYEEATSLFMLN
jgi:HD-like signal output (HDOD) protein